MNSLGEAICEAELTVGPGEGGAEGGGDLYLPELWRTGKRLTWKDEDARLKKFVGQKEPELTAEDIADMAKRVSSTPLPRAIEYLAGLPAYQPRPWDSYGFVPMDLSPDSALKNVKPRVGRVGGSVSYPSKFVPGRIEHRGYKCGQYRPLVK